MGHLDPVATQIYIFLFAFRSCQHVSRGGLLFTELFLEASIYLLRA